MPKTLLPVAGEPFASWQLRWLADAGIDSVVYCIGYLGEQVRAHVGTGARWGLRAEFVDEGEQLRGTAGAIRLAADLGVLDDHFLVLYGDSWLQVDPAEVLAAGAGEVALMTVFENADQWDASNVVYADGRVLRYEKNLDPLPPEMRWIDYGLSVLGRDLVLDRVPPGGHADLAPLCSALAREGRLAGFEVFERFYEIGSPSGLAEAERLLSRPDA